MQKAAPIRKFTNYIKKDGLLSGLANRVRESCPRVRPSMQLPQPMRVSSLPIEGEKTRDNKRDHTLAELRTLILSLSLIAPGSITKYGAAPTID